MSNEQSDFEKDKENLTSLTDEAISIDLYLNTEYKKFINKYSIPKILLAIEMQLTEEVYSIKETHNDFNPWEIETVLRSETLWTKKD